VFRSGALQKPSRRLGSGSGATAASQQERRGEDKQHEKTGPGFHFFLREKDGSIGVTRMTMDGWESSAKQKG
jgi:hypothetical protein